LPEPSSGTGRRTGTIFAAAAVAAVAGSGVVVGGAAAVGAAAGAVVGGKSGAVVVVVVVGIADGTAEDWRRRAGVRAAAEKLGADTPAAAAAVPVRGGGAGTRPDSCGWIRKWKTSSSRPWKRRMTFARERGPPSTWKTLCCCCCCCCSGCCAEPQPLAAAESPSPPPPEQQPAGAGTNHPSTRKYSSRTPDAAPELRMIARPRSDSTARLPEAPEAARSSDAYRADQDPAAAAAAAVGAGAVAVAVAGEARSCGFRPVWRRAQPERRGDRASVG